MMTKTANWRRSLLAAAIGIGVTLAMPLAGEAVALDLRQAKAQGLVGERADGLLGAVKGDGEVATLVARVNAGRMEKYRDIAGRNGTSVQAVQVVAGQDLIDSSPPGTYVMGPDSAWRRK